MTQRAPVQADGGHPGGRGLPRRRLRVHLYRRLLDGETTRRAGQIDGRCQALSQRHQKPRRLRTSTARFSLLRPRAEYCDDRVCLCVRLYVREHISGNTRPTFYRFFCARYLYGRGSVVLWRRCDTLCTSGLMDDVILAHKPRQLNVAVQLMEAQPTCSIGAAQGCLSERE